jgi:tripartite-type tricarboxylate transporter receptor subunit TctC
MRGITSTLASALAFAIALSSPSVAPAQDGRYLARPVRLLVASGPGGNPDILARLLADRMSKDLGKPFVVENVPGVGGVLAATTAAKAAPDGYTLMIGDTGNMAINPALNPSIGYDPIRDFTPITGLAAVPTILVANPQLKASTLSEFLALAKQEPGKIAYGSAGFGSIHHMTMAIFADQTGIDVLHVPYRGGTAMVNGLLTGEIQVGWSGIPNILQAMESGHLRGYCISVLQRSASTPAMPTCDELGVKGFDVASVMGLYGSTGMPPQVVARLQAEVAKLMREPAMAARMEQLGMVMKENGTTRYVEFTKHDSERYGEIVRRLGLQQLK